ncbi:MAG: carbohydrate ABC transporter permease, partial [Actinomycetota bacterium]|nr:carbohydrate ABC transporter permease [Actinomycetota bacterium]
MTANDNHPKHHGASSGPYSAKRQAPRSSKRFNIAGGLAGWIWLIIVIVPIYYMIVTSLKDQQDYFTSHPLLPSGNVTLANYGLVLENDFLRYFANSVIVTVGSTIPGVLLSFMAAFAIVRGVGRYFTTVNRLFLLGLAIPLQATIIPIYWAITRLHIYDTLLALIL